MNLHKILIIGLCAAFTISASAEWEIETHTDEITDVKSYSIGTVGDPYQISSYVKQSPKLIIRITPGGLNKNGQLLAKQEVIIDFEPDAIPRNGTTAAIRFGKAPAQTWECSPSTDRHSAFPENASKFITQLKSTDDLYFRFETTLGDIRTLHFTTSGLSEKTKEVVSIAKAELTTNASSAKHKPPPPPPKCAKCGGTGEIVTWKQCRRCYGSGTSGGAPCPKCRTSGRKGYTKQSAPCANCYGRQ